MRAFIPITKVDVERREVWGVAAEQRTDKTGREKFDYAASKPLFEAFAADFEKRTTAAGVAVSLGAIREMHEPKAAGRAVSWDFDDVEKQVRLCAKVVDDAAWEKVKEGVYTGFSIGGDYASRRPDPDEPGVTLYAARPVEVSLVDNPCMYGATFECVRADGAVELRKFTPSPEARMDMTALLARVDAAKAALAPLDATRPLAKSLWDVGRLAELLDQFRSIIACLRADGAYDNDAATDASALARLQEALAAMADGFAQLAAAEAAELTGGADADEPMSDAMLLASIGADLAKNDPGTAKKVMRRVQQIHDITMGFGATCAATKAAEPAADGLNKAAEAAPAAPEEDEMDAGTLQKALADHGDALVKKFGEVVDGAVAKAIEPVTAKLADVESRLAKVEATPAAPVPAVSRAGVAREDDTSGVAVSHEDAIAKAMALTDPNARILAVGKACRANGRPFVPGAH